MPSYPCRHPTCNAYVREPRGYCAEHQAEGQQARAELHRWYDQHQRDQDAKAFYNSAAWQRARAKKLATDPVCERCRRVFAQHVHHRIALKRCTPEQRLAQTNLMSLCHGCHSATEANTKRGERAT